MYAYCLVNVQGNPVAPTLPLMHGQIIHDLVVWLLGKLNLLSAAAKSEILFILPHQMNVRFLPETATVVFLLALIVSQLLPALVQDSCKTYIDVRLHYFIVSSLY